MWPTKASNNVNGLNLQKIHAHNAPLCSALYNVNFRQVVSGDESGVVCVWSVETGKQAFRFRETGKNVSKMTAMCFDDGCRRLVCGYHNGTVKDWNFNSGECLTTFRDRLEEPKEVTGVCYIQEVSFYFSFMQSRKKLIPKKNL